jgi:hypothetical protein
MRSEAGSGLRDGIENEATPQRGWLALVCWGATTAGMSGVDDHSYGYCIGMEPVRGGSRRS